MSNSTSTRQQPSITGTVTGKQTAPTSTVYSYEQQEKLLNLQEEVNLLLVQIQAETKLLAAR